MKPSWNPAGAAYRSRRCFPGLPGVIRWREGCWTCRRESISPGMFSGLLVLMGSWRGMCAAAWSGLEEDGLVPWFLLLPFPQTDWPAAAGICEALLSSTVGRSSPLLLGRCGWGMGCPPKSARESTAVTTYESSHLVSAGLSLSWLSWQREQAFHIYLLIYFLPMPVASSELQPLWCPKQLNGR